MVDDIRLVKQSKNGNRRAIAALYDAYQPLIYRYIAYRVGDTTVADDLTSEVFVAMVKSISNYQERGRPFLAWLYTIAGNVVRMHYRRHNRTELEPFSEELLDERPGPAEVFQIRLSQERLLAALPRLSDGQRQVILLKFIEGFSNSEIAAVMDKSEGAIRVMQHRALAALRQVLVEEVGREPA